MTVWVEDETTKITATIIYVNLAKDNRLSCFSVSLRGKYWLHSVISVEKMTPSWYRLVSKQAWLPVIAIPCLFPEELELKRRRNKIETKWNNCGSSTLQKKTEVQQEGTSLRCVSSQHRDLRWFRTAILSTRSETKPADLLIQQSVLLPRFITLTSEFLGQTGILNVVFRLWTEARLR